MQSEQHVGKYRNLRRRLVLNQWAIGDGTFGKLTSRDRVTRPATSTLETKLTTCRNAIRDAAAKDQKANPAIAECNQTTSRATYLSRIWQQSKAKAHVQMT